MPIKTIREEAIAQLVMSRLAMDVRTCGQTISVYVERGDVVLVGTCDTAEQKVVAKSIALGICGVGRVVDRIRVRRLASSDIQSACWLD